MIVVKCETAYILGVCVSYVAVFVMVDHFHCVCVIVDYEV